MPCTDGRELQPPTRGSRARATSAALSGPRCEKGRALDVIEDLAALSLEFALGDGSALAKLVQLTHVRDQVHERRRKPLVQMQVFLTVELWRPGVPRLEIKECLERRVGDCEGLDTVYLYGHEPHRDAVGGMHQIAVEVALEDLAVLKADCHLLVGTRPLGGGGYSASERNALDRGQWGKGDLIFADLVGLLNQVLGAVELVL